MRRRSLLKSSGGGTDPLEAAFWDGNNIVIREQKDWLDGETPIGIVVVPGSHDRYGDGSCGIMSLVEMDYKHPTSGAPVSYSVETVTMKYGYYGGYVGNDIFSSKIALTSSSNYIPYQTNSASTACSADSEALVWPYDGTTTEPTNAASTAYANTGGYVSATSGKSGCDFNGIRNTVALYVATRDSTQWRASIVENKNLTGTTGNTPAAACAGRFKTVGTKSFLDVFSGITSNDLNYGTPASTKDNKGFWYLPAEGELCYLPSKRFEINKTILALNQKYGNVGAQLNTSYSYWPSSEYDDYGAWNVYARDGNMTHQYKMSIAYVRAFLRF